MQYACYRKIPQSPVKRSKTQKLDMVEFPAIEAEENNRNLLFQLHVFYFSSNYSVNDFKLAQLRTHIFHDLLLQSFNTKKRPFLGFIC